VTKTGLDFASDVAGSIPVAGNIVKAISASLKRIIEVVQVCSILVLS